MRAVVLAKHGDPDVLVASNQPIPKPASDELLVRVTACGVCGHDILARRGWLDAEPGMVLGHEIAGVVESAGAEVTELRSGDRVALVQRMPCGSCSECRSGATNMCRSGPGFYGEDLAGGYAEYVLASPRNAVQLPEAIDDATGAILSCALGTALRALRTAAVSAGEVVVVTGAGGGVGVHTVQLAADLGATVVACTTSPDKGETLRRLGANAVLTEVTGRELRRVIADLGWPRGADAAIEITGHPTFDAALTSIGPRGRLVLVGNTDPAALTVNPGLVIVKELQVLGSAHATRTDLEEIVRLVSSGTIQPIAAQTWPLEQAAAAHEAVERRRLAGRAVLVP